MAHTFYDGTIPISQSILRTLRHILQKAESTHPNPPSLLSARLHETMYPLADQLRIATQYTENLAARLTDREPTQFGSNPVSLAEAFSRIDTVLASLAEADKDAVNANADKLSPTQVGPGVTVTKSGASYAHTIVLPNVYFHLNIAYGILRKEGVEIGKRDYYEGFFPSA
ncbi:hypothetical protein BJY01DRAFT_237755 [Aspergillus pseudoustus]|uniref:DUF1993 domain-containing protein n=1 Tax=Aspergillus pseudoustus TaxID=1810923 RepID=A0ABR4JC94_9EURO